MNEIACQVRIHFVHVVHHLVRFCGFIALYSREDEKFHIPICIFQKGNRVHINVATGFGFKTRKGFRGLGFRGLVFRGLGLGVLGLGV